MAAQGGFAPQVFKYFVYSFWWSTTHVPSGGFGLASLRTRSFSNMGSAVSNNTSEMRGHLRLHKLSNKATVLNWSQTERDEKSMRSLVVDTYAPKKRRLCAGKPNNLPLRIKLCPSKFLDDNSARKMSRLLGSLTSVFLVFPSSAKWSLFS